MSKDYLKYFDTRLGRLPDRSVITWRHIENHMAGCPELVNPQVKEEVSSPRLVPPAAAPPAVAVAGTAAAVPGDLRGDHQVDVIPSPSVEDSLSSPVPPAPVRSPLLVRFSLPAEEMPWPAVAVAGALIPSPAAGDTQAGDTGAGAALAAALSANALPVPQCEQDRAVSPFDVGTDTFVQQVADAEEFLTWCRKAMDTLDQYMQTATPVVQGQIREMLGELAGKVKKAARVQAIGEGSLEVAAPLNLV